MTDEASESADDLLTLRQAADQLGVKVGRVRELVQTGRMAGLRDPRGWWTVRRAAVDEYAKVRPSRPRPVTKDITRELLQAQSAVVNAEERTAKAIDRRNRTFVAWNDAGVTVTAIARESGVGRQTVHTILAETRAKLAEEAAKRGES